jgi:transcriptional regulator with XRE-family HTH domain
VAGRNGAVVRRLQLGRILRELREEAGLSLEVAAPALDWSSSKLSGIENGRQGVDVHGVRTMMDIYGVVGSQWDELLDLTRVVSTKGWWRAYGLDDTGYVPLETEASLVRDVTLGLVPGLLQTEEYMRAIFGSRLDPFAPDLLEGAVGARMIRQKRLTSDDDPLELIALIDEAAVRRQVGGPAAMRRQCLHLIAAADLKRVTLHVLPASVEVRPAMSGGFTLLTFEDLDLPDIAYAEHPLGSTNTDKPAAVDRANRLFARLHSLALDPDDSVALIQRVAAEM